tara:strand:- start:143 stop:670 length:528 start_codon:yes stop_codon:yes gene_type:complete
MSQFIQDKFNQRVWIDKKRTRIVSFSIIKVITYSSEEKALHKAGRLEKLHEDRDTFPEGIRIPYFEWSRDECELTYQAEYIKGAQCFARDWDMLRVKSAFLERENPWTTISFTPANFIVDTTTDDMWFIDLESYEYAPDMSKRIQYWNKHMVKHNFPDLIIQTDSSDSQDGADPA